jgi:hypothetical protein
VGLNHFGLKVGDSDDELREVLETLKANDVLIVGASDHTVTHSLYIQDPTATRSSSTSTSPASTGAPTRPSSPSW